MTTEYADFMSSDGTLDGSLTFTPLHVRAIDVAARCVAEVNRSQSSRWIGLAGLWLGRLEMANGRSLDQVLRAVGECSLCDTGHPLNAEREHYGSQRLGMIPNTPCRLNIDAIVTDLVYEAFGAKRANSARHELRLPRLCFGGPS